MPNTSVREAIERAKRVFAERPAAARKANVSATAVLGSGLRCEITGPDGERATTDMPAPMGGEASGPNPGWLLRASIASCAATAIAMRAAILDIAIKRLEVSVHSESDARGLLGMDDTSAALSDVRMNVEIEAEGASQEQLRELVEWAEAHSPVSCTLRKSPPVALDIQVV